MENFALAMKDKEGISRSLFMQMWCPQNVEDLKRTKNSAINSERKGMI